MESKTFNTTAPLPPEGQAACAADLPFLFVVLHCDQPTLGGARYCLSQIQEITIGRGAMREVSGSGDGSSRKLALRLPSATVSKKHARLVRNHEDWFLEDLGSKNGSCVNGVRVERARVQDGDFIEIGSVVLRYGIAKSALPGSDADSADVAAKAPGYVCLMPAYAAQLDALARVARMGVL